MTVRVGRRKDRFAYGLRGDLILGLPDELLRSDIERIERRTELADFL
jgi:hypothetical protein